MGVRSPVSGLGFRSVVRIISTMKLWGGPVLESTRCHCQSHAPLTEFSGGEVQAARHLETLWRRIHHFIFRVALSRPLRPLTRCETEGTWPEISETLVSGQDSLLGSDQLRSMEYVAPKARRARNRKKPRKSKDDGADPVSYTHLRAHET